LHTAEQLTGFVSFLKEPLTNRHFRGLLSCPLPLLANLTPDVWAKPCSIQKRHKERRMTSKVLNGVMLIVSTVLLASAFLPVQKPNPPRSLMLLGSGLVMLAGATRRYYADEK
jgi:hypothetical protein